MIAKKCDRCGTFYEPYEHYNGWGHMNHDINAMAIIEKRTCGADLIKGTYDLCKPCVDELIGFIKRRPTNETTTLHSPTA